MTGGGYMSYSTGIDKSRVVKIVSEKLDNQSEARDGFVLYKILPEKPMKAGGYALVLYTGENAHRGLLCAGVEQLLRFRRQLDSAHLQQRRMRQHLRAADRN